MGFEIVVSKKAQVEIENAIEYYSEINSKLALRFYAALKETYAKLEINSYYQIKLKNYRAVPIVKFPFLLFFVINEDKNEVKILSCFHTSRNPKKYPK
ncbi:type II toxin-antitoxin system RelE/ParE family toxin [Flavobacterium sp.]|uniref:type II toxin-antitoxin system RelE/ParE family toxin n=1 Tax=Flavobacterium sp. TaxID=239 RepID=UPI003F697A1E